MMKSREHLAQRMPSADEDFRQKSLGFIKSLLAPERSGHHINSELIVELSLSRGAMRFSSSLIASLSTPCFSLLPLIVAPRSIGEGVVRHLAEPCQSVLEWGTTSLPASCRAKTSEHLRKIKDHERQIHDWKGHDSFFQAYQGFSFSDPIIT